MVPNIMRKFVREEKGLALVLVAAAMTVILGFTALVVDVGTLYLNRSRLLNACDAAALAGAQELPGGNPEGVAEQYLLDNNITPEEIANKVEIQVSNDNTQLTVRASRDIQYTFARALGFTAGNVSAEATAEYGAVTSASGVAPFAVPDQQLVFNKQYVLKEGAGSSEEGLFRIHGNFGALALGGNGAKNYEENLKYGYSGTISAGDWVETEPGNMSGPTCDGVTYLMNQCNHGCTPDHFEPDCPRVILVPVFDPATLDQGRDDVLIVGFASFLLEGVQGNGKDSEVIGTFLQMAPPPDVSYDIDPNAPDYGLHAVRLID